MTARPDRVGEAVARMLRLLPAAGEPGHASEYGLATGLSCILRARLGPMERLTLASATIMSLDAEDAEALAQAALADLRGDALAEREAERQRRQFAEHCATSTYRSPPLSRREAREAARIRLDISPRAKLAEAWAQAPDRDRRDLIDRATKAVAA